MREDPKGLKETTPGRIPTSRSKSNLQFAKLPLVQDWGSANKPLSAAAERDESFKRAICAIPPGKVSTYGGVAEAAGYPRYHRAVARLLHQHDWDQLPWHRVLGASGEIKTSGASAKEQRARLRLEGVKFKGSRVDMDMFLHHPGRKRSAPPTGL